MRQIERQRMLAGQAAQVSNDRKDLATGNELAFPCPVDRWKSSHCAFIELTKKDNCYCASSIPPVE
jgi:hypothetical protein